MSKLTMAAAAAAGYVFGARAGRERYEQLSEKAESLWNNPTVQKGKRRAQDKAKDATSDGTESSLSDTSGHQDDNSDPFGQNSSQFNV
ncbi:MAG: hypothetical protein WA962_07610 [Ornithinimicrobium sp.]